MSIRAMLVSVLMMAWGTAGAMGAQTGRMQLTFTEHSPLGDLDQVLRRLGALHAPTAAEKASAAFDLAREPIDVFIPPNYRANLPHGLFVWMGVTDASPEWFDVLARHRLIFVSAKPIDEKIDWIRMQKPLDAVHNLKNRYNIDDKRIYVAGFSAGAEIAASILPAWSDVFRGGVFMNAGGFHFGATDETGRYISGVRYRTAWEAPLDDVRQSVAIVILRGQHDAVRKEDKWHEGRGVYDALLLDGFVRATFLEIPNGGHNHPDSFWFEKAINALDHPQLKKPPTTVPTKEPHPMPSQVAQAKRLIASAQHWLFLKSIWPVSQRKQADDGARAYLHQVLNEFPTTPSAAKAREMLAELDRAGSTTRPRK